jgi:hypothetical protein
MKAAPQKESLKSRLIEGFINSFDNVKDTGFSGRKLTGFTFIACIVYSHFIWGKNNAFTLEILIADIVGAAFFLGLVSFTQILELKNGSKKK